MSHSLPYDASTDLVPVDEKIITITEHPMPGAWPDAEPAMLVVTNEGVPTQVANPSRSSWRSFVQGLVGFLVVVNTALPIAQSWLAAEENTALLGALLGEHYLAILAGVNVAVGVGAFLTKGVALFMANPRINEWITTHLPWLAPIPQKRVEALPPAEGQ